MFFDVWRMVSTIHATSIRIYVRTFRNDRPKKRDLLSRKIRIWGLGSHFDVIVKKSVARKLRRIVLLHCTSETCRFHFWEIRKPFISMLSGFFDAPTTHKPIICVFWWHQDIAKITRHMKSFSGILFWRISKMENDNGGTFEKGRAARWLQAIQTNQTIGK